MFSMKKNVSFREKRRLALLAEIEQTQKDLSAAYLNFQDAVEPELIDFYIYQLKANQVKHQFLLRQLKETDYAKNPLPASGS
ncbi:MAG: YaaL family protein [Lachnospiraceae bacterium]